MPRRGRLAPGMSAGARWGRSSSRYDRLAAVGVGSGLMQNAAVAETFGVGGTGLAFARELAGPAAPRRGARHGAPVLGYTRITVPAMVVVSVAVGVALGFVIQGVRDAVVEAVAVTSGLMLIAASGALLWLATRRREPQPKHEFTAAATGESQPARDSLAVDELVQHTLAELAHKNAELEAANAEKTRFLAAASHDLRQPLHALALFSANLREGERDAERLKRIGHVQECVESLDRLFTGMLDVSRLDSGTEHAVATRFALDGLFVEVSQNFRALAESRGLRLVVRQTPLWVECDRGMLARVLNNLVCNAIRYTQSGGVLVGARIRDGQVRIDVWDTGVGIAPEHQACIFDEFVRLGEVDNGDRGLGLGLATVKRLCRLMQAPLEMRSRPGSGTVFQLRLPRVAQQTPVDTVVAAPAAIRTMNLRGQRILVIDDEAAILEGMDWLLQSWGCETRTAESADQALRHLDEGFAPDLVLADLRLREGKSGIEAIRAIRKRYLGRCAPSALLITGESCPQRLREAARMKLPMLCKPVSPAQLQQAIVDHLREPIPAMRLAN